MHSRAEAPLLSWPLPVHLIDRVLIPRSSVAGITWPALPAPQAAAMLALQYQLEQSQWWPPEMLREQQLRQLAKTLEHACETIPFYRERFLACGLDPQSAHWPDDFPKLPLLSRADVQAAAGALLSTRPPPEHGAVSEGQTSGSTGRPIRFFNTTMTQFFWRVFTLREHLWHQRDFMGKLAAIRKVPEAGARSGWGPSTDVVFDTGPSAALKIETDTGQQAAWLQEQDPDYLLSFPSNIEALARLCLAQGIRPGKLREVRAVGEVVTPELHRLCREAWGVRLVDVYSAQEVGYIALQCPETGHYHIQSEGVLVEILDAQGEPCKPGEVGRVVITTLHNMAMPLIRYEIGDFAEVGEACPCGRGLPVLKRIMGRVRNMLTLPSGAKRWPLMGIDRTHPAATSVKQYQFIQRSLDTIEVMLVTAWPLSQEEEALRTHLQFKLGFEFTINFTYCEDIPRSAGGKFEDFRSEL
ncbi:MAG: phenylacetate--CoA ligase family protein [Gammaproteobacteria bacterium]|nr:phenylacetate--CoA ligase family protein [Gammaproteobacteria bacterium]